jgi:hypothetical protein
MKKVKKFYLKEKRHGWYFLTSYFPMTYIFLEASSTVGGRNHWWWLWNTQRG